MPSHEDYVGGEFFVRMLDKACYERIREAGDWAWNGPVLFRREVPVARVFELMEHAWRAVVIDEQGREGLFAGDLALGDEIDAKGSMEDAFTRAAPHLPRSLSPEELGWKRSKPKAGNPSAGWHKSVGQRQLCVYSAYGGWVVLIYRNGRADIMCWQSCTPWAFPSYIEAMTRAETHIRKHMETEHD